jgi:hypothetical protein
VTSSEQKSAPTIGDLALEDLAAQLAVTAKSLAVLRAQHRQLLSFVESKADVLGLTRVEGDELPEDLPADPEQSNSQK